MTHLQLQSKRLEEGVDTCMSLLNRPCEYAYQLKRTCTEVGNQDG